MFIETAFLASLQHQSREIYYGMTEKWSHGIQAAVKFDWIK